MRCPACNYENPGIDAQVRLEGVDPKEILPSQKLRAEATETERCYWNYLWCAECSTGIRLMPNGEWITYQEYLNRGLGIKRTLPLHASSRLENMSPEAIRALAAAIKEREGEECQQVD